MNIYDVFRQIAIYIYPSEAHLIKLYVGKQFQTLQAHGKKLSFPKALKVMALGFLNVSFHSVV